MSTVNAFVDRGFVKFFLEDGEPVIYRDLTEPGHAKMLWRALWSAIEADHIPYGATVSGTCGRPFKAFYVRGMPAPLVEMLAERNIDLLVEHAPGVSPLSTTCPF